jgi:hypothetical protein
MNVNFGLFPPIEEARLDADGRRLRGPERGLARKRALSARAAADLADWLRRSAQEDSAVMARLDPAIHAEARIGSRDSDAPPRLDGRVKPGHDEPEKARPS